MTKSLLNQSYNLFNNKCSNAAALMFYILLVFSCYSLANTEETLSTYIKTNNIIQDNDGYIWFAGHNGLSRFDGSRVITFSSHSPQWNIPYSWIHNIRKVGNDFLISTESQQLWKFTPKSGKSEKVELNLTSPSIYNTMIFKGKYYMYAERKVYEYSPSSNTRSRLVNDFSTAYLEKTNNHLYAAGKDGVYIFNNDKFSPLNNEPTTSMTAFPDGVITINKNEISFINDNGTIKSIPNPHNYLLSTITNDGNALLLNKRGEVGKLSIANLEYLKHNYPNFEPMYPTQMLQDTSGTIWVLSNKGIKRLSPSFIKNIPKLYNVKNNYNEIALFKDKVAVGTYGDGIHSFMEMSPELPININTKLTPLAKKTMDILSIDDSLYIASFDGLWVYNSKTEKTKRVNFNNNNKLLLKLRQQQNLLYIGSNYNGFYIYNLDTHTIVEHIDVKDGLSSPEIIDIMTLDNKNIWLATPKGIDIYNLYTKKVKHIDTPGIGKIISFSTANNKVYAATKGDGIFVLNFHGDILSRIANGIDFTHIATIDQDIWAPAQHGLFRINPSKDSITLVPNSEKYTFTDAPVKLNNNVYVPHYGGMLEVQLETSEQFAPAIAISEITISGESFLANKTINVKSENDVISLTLASLDFRAGKNKKFRYNINSGKWNSIIGNQLTLTGLKSGDYNITIEGTNSLGEWSNKQTFSEISVKYNWYATTEMKIVYFIIFSLIAFKALWLLYLRSQSITHVHNLLSNDISTKGKSAFNVTRNLMQVKDLLINNKVSPSQESYEDILTIIQNSINELNYNDGDSEPNALFGKSLDIALPYLSDYIHKKHHVNVSIDNNIQAVELSYELQSDIYKIIYEALISAIINSKSNNFDVSLQEFKQKLWLTISNSENSFVNYNNKISFDMSMYFIRQIANKHNASINVFDKESSGSQLVISIPLMTIS